MRVREQRGDAVQPAEREQGGIQTVAQRAIDGERRHGRQRRGDEGANRLAPGGRGGDAAAGEAAGAALITMGYQGKPPSTRLQRNAITVAILQG